MPGYTKDQQDAITKALRVALAKARTRKIMKKNRFGYRNDSYVWAYINHGGTVKVHIDYYFSRFKRALDTGKEIMIYDENLKMLRYAHGKINLVPGHLLSVSEKSHALATYLTRYTGDFTPEFSRVGFFRDAEPPEFLTDEEWVSHSYFPTLPGTRGRLDREQTESPLAIPIEKTRRRRQILKSWKEDFLGIEHFVPPKQAKFREIHDQELRKRKGKDLSLEQRILIWNSVRHEVNRKYFAPPIEELDNYEAEQSQEGIQC